MSQAAHLYMLNFVNENPNKIVSSDDVKKHVFNVAGIPVGSTMPSDVDDFDRGENVPSWKKENPVMFSRIGRSMYRCLPVAEQVGTSTLTPGRTRRTGNTVTVKPVSPELSARQAEIRQLEQSIAEQGELQTLDAKIAELKAKLGQ